MVEQEETGQGASLARHLGAGLCSIWLVGSRILHYSTSASMPRITEDGWTFPLLPIGKEVVQKMDVSHRSYKYSRHLLKGHLLKGHLKVGDYQTQSADPLCVWPSCHGR